MTARTRLALGLVGIAATAAVVRRDRVGLREIRVFRSVNELPDQIYAPMWVVMQSGALGAAPVAAGVAWAAGRRRLARHLLLDGVAAWVLAKVVKRFVQRPRPVVLLPGTTCRGPEASGQGYVSGHAAVVVALLAAALPYLSRRGRVTALVVAPVVGLARMYVGAHLPLDVVGGAALGMAADAVVCLTEPQGSSTASSKTPASPTAGGAGDDPPTRAGVAVRVCSSRASWPESRARVDPVGSLVVCGRYRT